MSRGLYRAKPVAGGEMVKGFHCVVQGKHYIIPEFTKPYKHYGISFVELLIPVIESTVGQATGMKMNEVEIWEGDKFQGKDTGNIYWVVFRNGEYILVYDCKSSPVKAYQFCGLSYAIHNTAIEPIGTIHDKEPEDV